MENCVYDLMRKGYAFADAVSACNTLYQSAATPGVMYKSAIPGMPTTPGRLEAETLMLGEERKRYKRKYPGRVSG
jgi:hypothetical protein